MNAPAWLMALAVAAALSVATAAPSFARDDRWVVLGAASAAFEIDRDEINVGPNNGRFDSLRLETKDNDVLVQEIRVTSYEGAERTFRIDEIIRVGRPYGPIDLRGPLQSVRSIVLLYKTIGRDGGRRGTLTILGERGGREGAGWPDRPGGDADQDRFDVIASATFDRRAETVVFRTERGEGRLERIRIRARRDTIRVSTVTIVFANGERQSVEIYQGLVPGQASRTIAVELDRDRRRVEEVIVGKRPSFRSGVVELELEGVRLARPGDDDERPGRPPYAQESGAPRGWVLLGTQPVGFGVDRDVVKVGREAGQFEKIALRVLKNDIYLREVTLVFGNGERQSVNVNVELREGFRTAPLPLERGDRFIDRIELVYQSKPSRRGEAVVEVWGDYSDRWLRDIDSRRGHAGGWVLLGAQRAEMFRNDRDQLVVGERFGKFRAVRVAVRRHAVRVNSLRITYGNGEIEDVPVLSELRDGQTTEPIDLKGRGRYIERIELSYRTKLNFKGEGVVEVWGLH